MSAAIDLVVEERDGAVVVGVAGELDLYTAPALRSRLLGVIDEGARAVVLDLRGTSFLDSTALAVIIAATKALREAGGTLVLVNDRASIAKTLAITGLDRVLVVERDLDDGLARAVQA